MGLPHFEAALGLVNGANLHFSTVVAYTPGTLAVFRNGQLLLNAGGNPWLETSPSTGEFTIASEELPLSGDQIAVFYLDTSNAPAYLEMEQLFGTISVPAMSANISAAPSLSASLQTVALCAQIESPPTLSASIAAKTLHASIGCEPCAS